MNTLITAAVTLLLLYTAAYLATSKSARWRIVGWIFVAGLAAQFVTYGVLRALDP